LTDAGGIDSEHRPKSRRVGPVGRWLRFVHGKDGFRRAQKEGSMEKKTILIVDDEKNLRFLYEKEFTEEGFNVVTAADAAEAMKAYQEQHVDLIVLDIKLGDHDDGGLEALKRIRGVNKELPIVLNTAYASYKADFYSWLADAYVTKSSNLDELKGKVRELLR
jgi:DNA-binding response OmpR family regulator